LQRHHSDNATQYGLFENGGARCKAVQVNREVLASIKPQRRFRPFGDFHYNLKQLI
jgi:hypothetical protein